MEPGGDYIPGERLRRNLERVRAGLAAAAAKAARAVTEIKLIAVTKTVGPAEIRELLELGVRDFGEARVQDTEQKFRSFAPTPTPPGWHLIGHLQTNKADKAARLFQTVHTVDSLRVAQALSKERLKAALPPLPCLLEVNVARETQKFGLPPEPAAIGALLQQCAELPGLRLTGLMSMAPYSENPEATSRPVFRRLRELLAEANAGGFYPAPLTELSMGMTQDYMIAIEEGATMVRVGSALFE